MTDITLLSAAELVDLYRSKELSPKELIAATLKKIDHDNPVINAYRLVDHEAALRSAGESESRWMRGTPVSAVDGVSFGVKDLILARGHTTLFGSSARVPDQDVSADAPAVARLRESGAIFIGKTTTSEFGWKGTADSPLTGIARNPWNKTLTTGGSSGGAAAAAAAGLGVFQLGTDGGGSVRIPASFTGVVGMKATFGRVSAYPAGPMMTLSNVGPIARSVGDIALMLNVIARPDPRDWYALPNDGVDYCQGANDDLKGKRLGLYLGDRSTATEKEVEIAMQRLASAIENAGGVVEEVVLPIADLYGVFTTHWYAGAQHLVSQVPAERRVLMDKGLLEAARSGEALSVSTYYRATFARQRIGESLQQVAQQYDALLTPTLPVLPFEAGREWPADRPCASWLEWATFLYPFNLSRQPAASLPIGLSSDGRPIGAQVIGALYKDLQVIRICRAIERLLPKMHCPPV